MENGNFSGNLDGKMSLINGSNEVIGNGYFKGQFTNGNVSGGKVDYFYGENNRTTEYHYNMT